MPGSHRSRARVGLRCARSPRKRCPPGIASVDDDVPGPEPAVCRGVDGRRDPSMGRHPRDGDGRRGRRLRRPLGLRPPRVRRSRGRVERRVGVDDAAVGARGGRAAGPARHVRHGDAAAQPGAAGEDVRDARRGQRRAVHPRPRGRLERAGVHGLRRAVRASLRRVRGGPADHRGDVPRRARRAGSGPGGRRATPRSRHVARARQGPRS